MNIDEVRAIVETDPSQTTDLTVQLLVLHEAEQGLNLGSTNLENELF